MYIVSDSQNPLPPVDTCPHFADPLHVGTDANFEYNPEFVSKIMTLNMHLHHPSPYTNTKKVSHKNKYFLTTLIQDENREIINIYLKISFGNRRKMYLLYRIYVLPCVSTSTYSPDSNNCGVPRVGQFDKNLGQRLIVIVFR